MGIVKALVGVSVIALIVFFANRQDTQLNNERITEFVSESKIKKLQFDEDMYREQSFNASSKEQKKHYLNKANKIRAQLDKIEKEKEEAAERRRKLEQQSFDDLQKIRNVVEDEDEVNKAMGKEPAVSKSGEIKKKESVKKQVKEVSVPEKEVVEHKKNVQKEIEPIKKEIESYKDSVKKEVSQFKNSSVSELKKVEIIDSRNEEEFKEVNQKMNNFDNDFDKMFNNDSMNW